MTSFSFLPSFTAMSLISRTRSGGKSRVVFTEPFLWFSSFMSNFSLKRLLGLPASDDRPATRASSSRAPQEGPTCPCGSRFEVRPRVGIGDRLPEMLSGRLGGCWLRGIGPSLAEEALGRMGLSRCARGVLGIASKARCGPIPLRWAYLGDRLSGWGRGNGAGGQLRMNWACIRA
jgi:hypothetical protein